jgi:hypothetical protein
MSTETRGERLADGISKLREGLLIIGSIGGNKQDFIKLLVSSQAGARNLKELLKDNAILKSMVFSLVKSRNSRLAPDTIDKVIGDFLDVLFDLSQPVSGDEESEEQQ